MGAGNSAGTSTSTYAASLPGNSIRTSTRINTGERTNLKWLMSNKVFNLMVIARVLLLVPGQVSILVLTGNII